jgi:hypothetical protein
VWLLVWLLVLPPSAVVPLPSFQDEDDDIIML